MKETLAEYLKRVMHQKNLKVADVQASSGLSQGYINEVLRGAKTNLTIETIGILAEALDIDGFELFAAAYGKTPDSITVDPHLLADTIQKLILNPDLIELVQNTAKLKSQNHKEAVYEAARRLTHRVKAGRREKKWLLRLGQTKSLNCIPYNIAKFFFINIIFGGYLDQSS